MGGGGLELERKTQWLVLFIVYISLYKKAYILYYIIYITKVKYGIYRY